MTCECGSNLFHRVYHVRGPWIQVVEFDEIGNEEIVSTDVDHVRDNCREPKTMRCAECGKRNPNPKSKQKGEK